MEELLVSGRTLERVEGRIYVAEASVLGLAPGAWPEALILVEAPDLRFMRERALYGGDRGEDFMGWRYAGPRGLSVVIFND